MGQKLTENCALVDKFKFRTIDLVLNLGFLIFEGFGRGRQRIGIATAVYGVDLGLNFFVNGCVRLLNLYNLFKLKTFFAILLFDHFEVSVNFLQFFLLFRILRVIPYRVITGL